MWVSDSNDQDELVGSVVERLASEVLTAAIATVGEGTPWIFTAYVALKGNHLWFTSQETTRHVGEIRRFSDVAVALWKAPDAWGEQLRGLQLAGRATEVGAASEAEIGLDALHSKFSGTLETLPSSAAVIGASRKTCLFLVECQRGTVRDEVAMGKGRFPIVWRS